MEKSAVNEIHKIKWDSSTLSVDPGSATVPVAAGRVSRPAPYLGYSNQIKSSLTRGLLEKHGRRSVFVGTPNTAVETTVSPSFHPCCSCLVETRKLDDTSTRTLNANSRNHVPFSLQRDRGLGASFCSMSGRRDQRLEDRFGGRLRKYIQIWGTVRFVGRGNRRQQRNKLSRHGFILDD
jgi:hypothetical protein